MGKFLSKQPQAPISTRPRSLKSASQFSWLLKKSVSDVLASLRKFTHGTEYALPLHSLGRCWTAFLNSLLVRIPQYSLCRFEVKFRDQPQSFLSMLFHNHASGQCDGE